MKKLDEKDIMPGGFLKNLKKFNELNNHHKPSQSSLKIIKEVDKIDIIPTASI